MFVFYNTYKEKEMALHHLKEFSQVFRNKGNSSLSQRMNVMKSTKCEIEKLYISKVLLSKKDHHFEEKNICIFLEIMYNLSFLKWHTLYSENDLIFLGDIKQQIDKYLSIFNPK